MRNEYSCGECAPACAARNAKAERETARQEYIRMLRDVATALESDPTAFHGAALQVRDTSAVVCDAFQAGAVRAFTVVTVLDGDDMETSVDHVWGADVREAVRNAVRDGHTVAVFDGHLMDKGGG